jgi:glycyl-tRNA synthetase (class II)
MREFEQMEMQFFIHQELKKNGTNIGKKKNEMA